MPPAPPRVEVFLPVGVDCLVKPGFCRLWSFLTRNPALHSPFTSVMSLVTLSLQNHCSCIPVPPLPSTGLLLHWSQNEKDSGIPDSRGQAPALLAGSGVADCPLPGGSLPSFWLAGSVAGGEGCHADGPRAGNQGRPHISVALSLCNPAVLELRSLFPDALTSSAKSPPSAEAGGRVRLK